MDLEAVDAGDDIARGQAGVGAAGPSAATESTRAPATIDEDATVGAAGRRWWPLRRHWSRYPSTRAPPSPTATSWRATPRTSSDGRKTAMVDFPVPVVISSRPDTWPLPSRSGQPRSSWAIGAWTAVAEKVVVGASASTADCPVETTGAGVDLDDAGAPPGPGVEGRGHRDAPDRRVAVVEHCGRQVVVDPEHGQAGGLVHPDHPGRLAGAVRPRPR